jgi:hypothetical protein
MHTSKGTKKEERDVERKFDEIFTGTYYPLFMPWCFLLQWKPLGQLLRNICFRTLTLIFSRCGKTLDWKTAVPYKRSGADKARLPKTLADVSRHTQHMLV